MRTGVHEEIEIPTVSEPTLVERLAEKVGQQARASAVFAEPVDRHGVTVIPVARVRWGFGGGGAKNRPTREPEGAQAGAAQQGAGGGGAVIASPVGYIEIRDGETRFRPIRGSAAALPLVLAGGALTLLFLRAVARVVGEP